VCTATTRTPVTTAALGESCASNPCRGSYCDDATKHCVAFKTSGACTSSGQCNVYQGFACEDASKTCLPFTGTVVRAKVGEACGAQADNSYVQCAPGLTCSAGAKVCVDALSTCTAP